MYFSLPVDISKEFVRKYNIKQSYADILVSDKETINYTKTALNISVKENVDTNDVASAIVNKIVNTTKTNPKELVLSIKNKKQSTITDEKTLQDMAIKAINNNPKAVEDYKGGKTEAIAVLIGKVMQASKGKADANMVKEILKASLDNKNTS